MATIRKEFMKKKTLGVLVAAIAALSVFASSALAQDGLYFQANAGPVPAHYVQTPTGPMLVPDDLVEEGIWPETGEPWKVEGVECSYASADQSSHYTKAEIEADMFNWCFRDPGTIPVPASLAKTHVKKATHKASKAAKHHRSTRH